jgi:hypothetical protein
VSLVVEEIARLEIMKYTKMSCSMARLAPILLDGFLRIVSLMYHDQDVVIRFVFRH